MRPLASDLRFAFRTLIKNPLFTGIAIASLALGIGANTAIFILVDQLLLRLLPVQQPEQLTLLTRKGPVMGNNRGEDSFSYPLYCDLRDRTKVFSGLLGWYSVPVSLASGGRTERVQGELVTGNYFQILGVHAAAGRLFTPDDDKLLGGHPVVVLNHRYWQDRFRSDPSVIGRVIRVNDFPMTVIGVAGQGFDGMNTGLSVEMFIPMMMKKQMTPGWDDMKNRRSMWMHVIGRMNPGVSIEQAKAETDTLYHRILEDEVKQPEFAKTPPFWRGRFLKTEFNLLPAGKGRSDLRKKFREALLVLTAVVGLVLLIACANVANLLLAKAASRRKEVAIRLALGASRWQLTRQLLVESLLLSLTGGFIGLLLSALTTKFLLAFLPQSDSAMVISGLPDLRILAFTLALSVATGVLFGLAPAIQATRPEVAPTLKDQAGSISTGEHFAFRKLLVAGQVALSVLLLIGAGLFIRTLRNLATVNPGFKTSNVVAFALDPSLNGYDSDRAHDFFRRLNAQLNSTPGVISSAIVRVALLAGDEWDGSVTVEGYKASVEEDMNPWFNFISPGYFATMQQPLLQGRDFEAKDGKDSPKVVIVNESFAKHYFGNRSPLGHHIGKGGMASKTDYEIIGVMKDSKYRNIRDEVPRQNFFNYEQSPITESYIYTRTSLPATQMFAAIRRQVQMIDPSLPIYDMKTLDKQVEESMATERLIATLSSGFGLLATVLAAVGVYGVMGFMVTQRTREIGIRVALGALNRHVIWLVMKEVVVLVAIGLLIGIPGAYGLSRLVSSQLFNVSPTDPSTLMAAAVGIAAVAALAGYAPARRAMNVDPLQALRTD